jgi:class 3 adenylate cyclase
MADLTIAFVDLTGSVSVFETLGNDQATQAVTRLTQWIGSVGVDNGGTVVKMLGDGALVEFLSVVDAAAWAVELQNKLRPHPRTRLSAGRLVFRVGVAVGDVIVNQTDRVGEGVTLAVRVQECAEPGGVALSDQAYQLIRGKTSARFVDGGMRVLKGIATPMHIWVWDGQEAG